MPPLLGEVRIWSFSSSGWHYASITGKESFRAKGANFETKQRSFSWFRRRSGRSRCEFREWRSGCHGSTGRIRRSDQRLHASQIETLSSFLVLCSRRDLADAYAALEDRSRGARGRGRGRSALLSFPGTAAAAGQSEGSEGNHSHDDQ